MYKIWRVCFFISFLLFTGCSQKNLEKNVSISKPKQEKEIKQYPYCKKHQSIMEFATKYIDEEFEKAYLKEKDTVGAKAQIYLIENNTQTVFAKNINAARKSYKTQFELAKENNCNIEDFKTFPLDKIKEKIQLIEEKK
ncbi:hypothetical protein [Halarcobacter sp.]|uniref:hypothetical protein n=1 Tax=Halarcobacter sp. TaxID=2321133 RepID=UPI0029F4ED1A|nr:hypothetical protein [Halarcobacter sp.]